MILGKEVKDAGEGIKQIAHYPRLFFWVGGSALAGPGQDLQEIADGIAQDLPALVKEFEELARDLAHREQSRVKKQLSEMGGESPGPTGARMLLFITLGEKPEENLEENRRMLKEIKETSPEVVVVLRGLPHGQRTLGEMFRYIRQLTDKDSPQVMLNPFAVSAAWRFRGSDPGL